MSESFSSFEQRYLQAREDGNVTEVISWPEVVEQVNAYAERNDLSPQEREELIDHWAGSYQRDVVAARQKSYEESGLKQAANDHEYGSPELELV